MNDENGLSMASDLRLCSVFILAEKKERVRFVEYFNDRLVTLLYFTSSAHLAALIKKHNSKGHAKTHDYS